MIPVPTSSGGPPEFAARGFDGAGVDRIARRARVNKAMIYYHFGSKLSLYRAVLREGLGELIGNAHAATAGPAAPIDKFDAYVRALLHTVDDRAYLVPHPAARDGRRRTQARPRDDAADGRPLQVVRGVMAEGQRDRGTSGTWTRC